MNRARRHSVGHRRYRQLAGAFRDIVNVMAAGVGAHGIEVAGSQNADSLFTRIGMVLIRVDMQVQADEWRGSPRVT